MKTSTNWLTALASLVVLVGATTAQAADSKERLTPEDIGTRLDQLGYEYTAYEDSKSKLIDYVVVVPRDGRNWKVTIAFSGNQQWIYVYALGAKLPSAVPPHKVLVKLLSATPKIEPAHFGFNEKTKYLYVRIGLHNTKSVTNRLLRERIENTVSVLAEYEDLWNPNKWPAPAASSPPPGSGPTSAVPPHSPPVVTPLGQ